MWRFELSARQGASFLHTVPESLTQFSLRTCTIHHDVIIKGNLATKVPYARAIRPSVGISRVKMFAEGFSGRLSGSVEGSGDRVEGSYRISI
jgi:hypothetical protein